MKVLVTGASGFIGRYLVPVLRQADMDVVCTSRSDRLGCVRVSNFSSEEWGNILKDVEVVVHLAGRAHGSQDTLDLFMRDNRDFSIFLAEAAIRAGVRRFIYFSSLGVHEGEFGKVRITPDTPLCPVQNYAKSKAEAETELQKRFAETEQNELIVIRPPLVFAHDAPGNFGKLLRLVKKLPVLPFGGCRQAKSFVSIERLVKFTAACISSPRAQSGVFICAEPSDTSLGQVVFELATGMGKSHTVINFPERLIALALKLFGKSNVYHKMFGSLTVDSTSCEELLAEVPTPPIDQLLRAAGKKFGG